jgi:hypothetical protein
VLSLGVLYVIAVVAVAVLRGLAYAVPVSVASMLVFNFLFLQRCASQTVAGGCDDGGVDLIDDERPPDCAQLGAQRAAIRRLPIPPRVPAKFSELEELDENRCGGHRGRGLS